METRYVAAMALGAALLGGCDLTDPGEVRTGELRTDRAAYRMGEDALVTLTNDTDREMEYLPCLVWGIEHRPLATWKVFRDRSCGAPWEVLEPGQSYTRSFPVGAPWTNDTGVTTEPFRPGGSFRVVTPVRLRGFVEYTTVRSNLFTLEDWP